MSEVTTATDQPPPSADGLVGYRYPWRPAADRRPVPDRPGPAVPPGPVPAAGVAAPAGASPACRSGAHGGCPQRVGTAGAGRRWCGCGCHRRAERLAYVFYLLAATAAVIGQVWVAVEHIPWSPGWPMWVRVGVVVPFAVCLELLGMVTAAMADERMRAGERAVALRLFSAGVATVAVSVIVVGHWPELYLVVGFGAFSAAAYLLWMLHSGARRRDALRAAGLLSRVAPAYGWSRWLPLVGRPGWRVTHRARELALEHGLGLHESLQAAEQQLRARARRPAIAAAVRAVVRANHADPLMAEIAVRTLDHDRIAAELEAGADYAGWARRLAVAVSASPAMAVSGPEPDNQSADSATGAGPDNPAAPLRRRPDRRRTDPPEPDSPPAGPDTHNGQPTAAQVAEAMSRTPRPTQVSVAREFGISDRTVRRYLSRQDGSPREV